MMKSYVFHSSGGVTSAKHLIVGVLGGFSSEVLGVGLDALWVTGVHFQLC